MKNFFLSIFLILFSSLCNASVQFNTPSVSCLTVSGYAYFDTDLTIHNPVLLIIDNTIYSELHTDLYKPLGNDGDRHWYHEPFPDRYIDGQVHSWTVSLIGYGVLGSGTIDTSSCLAFNQTSNDVQLISVQRVLILIGCSLMFALGMLMGRQN